MRNGKDPDQTLKRENSTNTRNRVVFQWLGNRKPRNGSEKQKFPEKYLEFTSKKEKYELGSVFPKRFPV